MLFHVWQGLLHFLSLKEFLANRFHADSVINSEMSGKKNQIRIVGHLEDGQDQVKPRLASCLVSLEPKNKGKFIKCFSSVRARGPGYESFCSMEAQCRLAILHVGVDSLC